eukprot:gb/GECH01014824.1/.p1 GENE.gb/GECH01014824.1/~~gb/GECH01014824.1/.p1  ORF type:complete len:570 (+),score=79.25 gb/GECH01014824.1/:1-1710(+)
MVTLTYHNGGERNPLLNDSKSPLQNEEKHVSYNSKDSTFPSSSPPSTTSSELSSISPSTTSSSSPSEYGSYLEYEFNQTNLSQDKKQNTNLLSSIATPDWEVANHFDSEMSPFSFQHEHEHINQEKNVQETISTFFSTFKERICCNLFPLSMFSFSKRVKSIYTAIMFCIFFFFYLFKPSEPFLVDFLTDSKGFSQQTVFYKIFPLWVYAHMIAQIGVTLIPEFLSHNLVVFIGMMMAVTTILILLFAKSLIWMQIQQVTVAVTFAVQPIATAALYHTMPCSVYQLVTSLTRSCTLLGTVSSSLLGQLLYLHGIPLKYLFIISLVAALFCAILCVGLLPYVPSLRKIRRIQGSQKTPIWTTLKEIMLSYSNSFSVSIWSIYSIVLMAVHGLMITYYQNLVKELDPSLTYNGYFIGVAYTLAAIGALLPCRADRFIPAAWNYMLTPAMCIIFPLVMGICFLGLSVARSLILLYSLLVVIHTFFEMSIVVAFTQIAQGLHVSRFASIFSLNQTVSLIFQFLLQLIVGESVLKLNVQHEFAAFGFVLLALSIVMLLTAIGRTVWRHGVGRQR